MRRVARRRPSPSRPCPRSRSPAGRRARSLGVGLASRMPLRSALPCELPSVARLILIHCLSSRSRLREGRRAQVEDVAVDERVDRDRCRRSASSFIAQLPGSAVAVVEDAAAAAGQPLGRDCEVGLEAAGVRGLRRRARDVRRAWPRSRRHRRRSRPTSEHERTKREARASVLPLHRLPLRDGDRLPVRASARRLPIVTSVCRM